MKNIYKYTIDFDRYDATIALPTGATILDIHLQHKEFVLWALVDPTVQTTYTVSFILYGTGWDIEEPEDMLEYMKTVQDSDGFGYHIFKKTR